MTVPRILNLLLLILFPIAWAAPLLRAGLLPIFGMTEISVLSGVQSLWDTDIFLALIVVVLALIAPIAKVIALEGLLGGWLPARVKPYLFHLARLAMADVFLIAIYITVIKGLGIGRVDVVWGLYLFTGCVLASLGLSIFAQKQNKAA
ncbi:MULTISPECIES: paraquat-inducible protein A [Pacificibacter]|uniref:paraquat-inducible protein A n=1 Tax=Pacificibacter TaxID=1042323 RepID=UPI001C0A301F|nr:MULTISPECIES: paraquat-inducible protein A [Pacificibacter]MBU2935706.1 paraquat-inducible protein A [Pacificibacter marinus]MDO6614202.1 paraquat-inducible protein A [Pacificibacter sp. 1_MG-2023]